MADKIKELTCCTVTGDGEEIRLSMKDEKDVSHTLALSAHQAGSLAMTLPNLLTQSLRLKHKDNSIRYVFPLDHFKLELSTARAFILTLHAPQGFAASFGISEYELQRLLKIVAASLKQECDIPSLQ